MRTDVSSGLPLAGLARGELEFFAMGQVEFAEAEGAADGLGPRMNLDNCGGCHAQPRFGGSSPRTNPQVAFGKQSRAGELPSFVTADGPIRVVRIVRNPDGSVDGKVQPLFTIAGRRDAPGCELAQPDFNAAFAKKNAVFRIPTPVYGAGLIEQIPDSAILANQGVNAAQKKALGIAGKANVASLGATAGTTPPPGTQGPVARFGWKADNHSVLVAAAAAYHTEMGISNEIFPTEKIETAACRFTSGRSDPADLAGLPAIDTVQRYRNPLAHRYLFETGELRDRLAAFAERNPPGSRALLDMHGWTPDLATSIEKLAAFIRLLAPPTPSKDTPGGAPSIARGAETFNQVGCAACHTPMLRTGDSTIAVLADKPVNLYSDLLLHDMGPGLADGIPQGRAGPRDFRTAPLWGLGERIYLLHDGRTTDVLEAIVLHQGGSAAADDASEANAVIERFVKLREPEKQDLLNFLRSL